MSNPTLRSLHEYARTHRLWAVALVLTLLMPVFLLTARVGMEVASFGIVLCFLLHSYRTRDWAWTRLPIARLGLLMWAWLLVVVTPLSVDPADGFDNALLWGRFPLMLLAMFTWVLVMPEARRVLAHLILALVAFSVVDCWWQFFHGVSLTGNERIPGGRLTGPFHSPKIGLYLSKLMIPAVAILVSDALLRRDRRWVMGGLLMLAITMITVLFTGERAAFLTGMLAIVVAMALLMLVDKRLRVPGLIAGAVTLAALVVLVMTSPWIGERAGEMYTKILNYPQSDYGVLAIGGLKIAQDYWLHGSGIGGFQDLATFVTYEGHPFQGTHPHNAYIEWLTDAGVPGFLMFLTLIALFARAAWRAFRAGGALATCILPAAALGILAEHFFPFVGMQSFFKNWSAMMLWFPIALIFSSLPKPFASSDSKR